MPTNSAQASTASVAVAPSTLKKVSEIAAKAAYEAPKSVSYPINGIEISDLMSFTGNT